MAYNSDVSINITLINAVTTNRFAVPAFFVPADKAGYKEYTDLDSLETDLDELTSNNFVPMAKAKAHAFMGQANTGGRFAVVTYVAGEILDAYKAYKANGWQWAMPAFDALEITAPTTGINADAVALSNAIELDQQRALVLNTTPANALKNVTSLVGNANTIVMAGLVSASAIEEGNQLDAALIGAYGNAPVGSINFHDLNGLKGIYDALKFVTPEQINGLTNINVMTYYTKINGVAQTSIGKTINGSYIDVLEGRDWVSVNMQMAIQNVLTNNNKVSYDNAGLALIRQAMDDTLSTAWDNGIVATDVTNKAQYTITSVPLSEIKPEDVASRKFNGFAFSYKAASAVDTVAISGQVFA